METATEQTLIPVPEIAQMLDQNVISVLNSNAISGFTRAYTMAEAIGTLKSLLTPEYMKPIMNLQKSRLGFKADKEYPEDVVKNCVIEAVLMGVQVTGNQFNIIAGNTYITKEGFGYLLKNVSGLNYKISFELPRMNEKSAAVVANVSWTIGNATSTQRLDLPIKVKSYMGADGVIGKAERKARKWLYETVTGQEMPDGDIEGSVTIIETLGASPEDKEAERKRLMLLDCKTVEDVDTLAQNNPEWDAQLFADRKAELKNGSAQTADKLYEGKKIQAEATLKAKQREYDALTDEEKMSEKGQTLLFEIDQLKGAAK